jgi:hypothetical protein
LATDEEIDKFLAVIKEAKASSVWLFIQGTKEKDWSTSWAVPTA